MRLAPAHPLRSTSGGSGPGAGQAFKWRGLHHRAVLASALALARGSARLKEIQICRRRGHVFHQDGVLGGDFSSRDLPDNFHIGFPSLYSPYPILFSSFLPWPQSRSPRVVAANNGWPGQDPPACRPCSLGQAEMSATSDTLRGKGWRKWLLMQAFLP